MLITLPLWCRFVLVTEAVILVVAAAIIHPTKSTNQSGIEFSPATF
jgi:hypothetical protein